MSLGKLTTIASAFTGALQRKQSAIRTSSRHSLGYKWQKFYFATARSICKFACQKLLPKKGLELQCMKDTGHQIKLEQVDSY